MGSLRPFDEHLAEVQALAEHTIQMILDTDVFVVFNDPEGSDLFTELGVCLAKKSQGGNVTRVGST